jgi:Cu2+-exporting ATPase
MTEERLVQVGSERFMQQQQLAIPASVAPLQAQAAAQGYSLIYVAIDQRVAGVLEIRPSIRPEAAEIVRTLKQRGLKLYIISGDHQQPTQHLAQALGIDHYFAEVLPENKAALVQQLRDDGRFVCFIGDGINDAIALKAAQVSVSLKGASSVATDTAQIVFMDGTLERLPTLLSLSTEFEQTMQTNLVSSFAPGILNIAGIVFLHTGIATGMALYYLGAVAGLGVSLRPLIRHQQTLAELPAPTTP